MHFTSIIAVGTIGLTGLISATPLPPINIEDVCIMGDDRYGNPTPHSCIPIPRVDVFDGLGYRKLKPRKEEKPKKKVIVGINEFDMRGLETRNGKRKITPVKPSQTGIYVQEDDGSWKPVSNQVAEDSNQKGDDKKASPSGISKRKEAEAKGSVNPHEILATRPEWWWPLEHIAPTMIPREEANEQEISNMVMPDLEEYEMILVREGGREEEIASSNLHSRSEIEKRIDISAQGVNQWCIRRYDWSTRRCAKITGERPLWQLMGVTCPDNGLFGC